MNFQLLTQYLPLFSGGNLGYNVPMKLANTAEQDLVEAMARGWGDRDSSAPFSLQEERAGVKVRRS